MNIVHANSSGLVVVVTIEIVDYFLWFDGLTGESRESWTMFSEHGRELEILERFV